MTDEQWEFVAAKLRELEQQYRSLEAAADGIGLPPDSPLIDPFYRVAELLIAALSAQTGDSENWLSWYVYECRFGENPLRAWNGEIDILVNSLEKLRRLIEATRADGPAE